MAKHKGYIIDRGLSPIDNKPYVAILTLKTSNRKTGNMAQVWILREDVNPVEAIATGEDVSICGSCPHRKQQDGSRSCYVNVGQAPLAVWKGYQRGIYPVASYLTLSQVLRGRKIRWGAYGDPAIIDPGIVVTLNGYSVGHTGYTHQWREEWAAPFMGIYQASCDGFADYLSATERGWQTFTVVGKGVKPDYAKLCPATAENSQAQCLTCSLCDGAKTSIYVEAHGTGSKYVTAA